MRMKHIFRPKSRKCETDAKGSLFSGHISASSERSNAALRFGDRSEFDSAINVGCFGEPESFDSHLRGLVGAKRQCSACPSRGNDGPGVEPALCLSQLLR